MTLNLAGISSSTSVFVWPILTKRTGSRLRQAQLTSDMHHNFARQVGRRRPRPCDVARHDPRHSGHNPASTNPYRRIGRTSRFTDHPAPTGYRSTNCGMCGIISSENCRVRSRRKPRHPVTSWPRPEREGVVYRGFVRGTRDPIETAPRLTASAPLHVPGRRESSAPRTDWLGIILRAPSPLSRSRETEPGETHLAGAEPQSGPIRTYPQPVNTASCMLARIVGA